MKNNRWTLPRALDHPLRPYPVQGLGGFGYVASPADPLPLCQCPPQQNRVVSQAGCIRTLSLSSNSLNVAASLSTLSSHAKGWCLQTRMVQAEGVQGSECMWLACCLLHFRFWRSCATTSPRPNPTNFSKVKKCLVMHCVCVCMCVYVCVCVVP